MVYPLFESSSQVLLFQRNQKVKAFSGDPNPPIKGGLCRLTCGAVLMQPVDMGGGHGGKKRKVVRLFTRRV
jgi:hypothetical protein